MTSLPPIFIWSVQHKSAFSDMDIIMNGNHRIGSDYMRYFEKKAWCCIPLTGIRKPSELVQQASATPCRHILILLNYIFFVLENMIIYSKENAHFPPLVKNTTINMLAFQRNMQRNPMGDGSWSSGRYICGTPPPPYWRPTREGFLCFSLLQGLQKLSKRWIECPTWRNTPRLGPLEKLICFKIK